MTDPTSTPLTATGGLPRLTAAKSLFSQHYLQARLPEHPEWAADPRPVFETVAALWERARALGGTWNEAQTEQEFVKPVLDALGWSYIVQVKAQRRDVRKRAARRLAGGAGERGVWPYAR